MRSPLLAVAACFALGIALEHSERPSLPGMPLWLGCAVCLLAGLIALRAELRALPFLLALAGFVGAGAIAARLFEFRFPPNRVSRLAAQGIDLTEPVHLEGRVVSTPFRTAYGHQFDLEVERLESGGRLHPVTGRVRLRLQHGENGEAEAAAEALHLQYGDSIRAPVRLRRPPVYQNPGGFDFRRWMESIEDLDWLGTIRSPLLIEKLPGSGAFQLGGLLESTRRRLRDGIDRMYPPWSGEARNGAVLKAVLLGDRSSLNSETIENFRRAGLYHLLVIAGLHVGLLAMLAALLLRLVPIREPWRWAAVLLFLLAYASLVEQRASTLRATVMITVYLLARLVYREHAALNAVGVAALVLLVGRPAWLFEAGFQLSFSAALLIVALVAPILELTTEPYRRALRRLRDVDLDASLPPRQARFRLDLRDLIKVLAEHVLFLKRHPSLSAALVTGPAQVMLWGANVVFFAAMLQLGLLLPMAETFHRVSYAGIGLNALAIPVMTLLLAVAVPAVVFSSLLPALGPWLARLLAPLLSAVFALTDLPNLPVWLSYRVPEPPSWVAWGFALAVFVAEAWRTVARRRRATRS